MACSRPRTDALHDCRAVLAAPGERPGLGTFAVDAGHRLYIDFESVTPRGVKWCSEALLHEASHVLQRHDLLAAELGANNDKNLHRVINVAADCAINDDLVEAGCTSLADDGITPDKIGAEDNMTPHHYYEILRKKQQQAQKNKPKPQPGKGQPSKSDGQGEDSDGEPGQTSAGNSSSAGGNEPYKGCGSGSGGVSAPCELDPEDTFGGEAPAASELEKERNAIATAAAIREEVSKGRGRVPAGMIEWAEMTLTPTKTPWQQVLAAHVRRAIASKAGNYDADPSRRHRRRHRVEVKDQTGHILGNLVVPGTYTPVPTIAVVRDTSGSMNASDLATVTNEVESIARKMGIRGRELTVTDVDAKAYDTRAYKGPKMMETVQGRGGTNMCIGIELMSKARPRPTAIVVLTDGGTAWPESSMGVPVVAAIIDRSGTQANSEQQPPKWIKTVYIDIDDIVTA